MQTTELFVEQVVIGLLVLVVGVVLASPGLAANLADAKLGEAAVVLAGAYLVGIVYDRYADTLVEDLERHHRLVFGLQTWTRKSNTAGLQMDATPPEEDPFPEDQYRIAVMRDEQASLYANYLRSRIRLTRALATLAPAIGAAAVFFRLDGPGLAPARAWLVGTVIVAYSVPFIWSLVKARDARRRLPRTSDLKVLRIYQDYRRLVGYSDDLEGPRSGEMSLAFQTIPFWFATGLSGVSAVLGWWYVGGHVYLVPIISFALMLLAGWSWWRITETFYRLLQSCAPKG